ncbi:MAG: methyl-accepting chemotaxis protein [Ignavibacteria bacterium]|nr:methyl-accepting chemotaxis protein [Ignavibacteria bacterium]
MQWFMNLSLRTKIGVILGLLSSILLAIVYYSYNNVNKIRERQEDLSGKYFQIQGNALKLHDELSFFRMEILQSLSKNGSKQVQGLERKFASYNVVIDALFKSLGSLSKNDDLYGTEISNLAVLFEDYRKLTESHMLIMRSHPSTEDTDSIYAQQAAQFNEISQKVMHFVASSQKDITAHFQDTNTQIVKTIVVFLWTAVLFFLITAVTLVQANKILSNPINTLAEASTRLASGDVEIDIPVQNRGDEIGKLYTAFLSMLNSIKELGRITNSIADGDLSITLAQKSDKDAIVRSLNTMGQRLRTVIAESKDSIEVLSNATNKIFGAVSQLSASSNETATAIGETTVTIEEVKKTSEVLSRKAREINTIAQRASEISETGVRSTEDTIRGIQNIGNQMEIIGESIIKLTEQSRAIGDIIASVNDLAEQSNLLAVNAAIEAARAGEHGKSFVVVAQEIKSLAQQSKQATAQVKSVLNDIQNAINATVLATEQGEKIVNAGVTLSEQTREAIRNLTDTITMFTDISIQTNASSQEQFIGMEQVAIAMDNIKVASSQNAIITRELESSARNLQMLTEKLHETIAVFKV